MLTAALDGLVARFGLPGSGSGEVVAGAVLKHAATSTSPASACSARGSTTPPRPTTSSRPAAPAWRRRSWSPTRSRSARSSAGIAGGVDTTSDAPLAVNEDLRQVLLELNRAQTLAARLKLARPSCARARSFPEIPRNAEPRTGLSMGEHAGASPRELEHHRARRRTSSPLASHQRLAAAYDRGFFDDLITPYLGLDARPEPAAGPDLEKLAKLKPVFGRAGDDATMTAGNSTPLTDGAAVVLLASRRVGGGAQPAGARLPRARRDGGGRLRARRRGAADGPGRTPCRGCSPAPGLTLQDFDFYEIHEAFASQVLATLAAWEDAGRSASERLGLDAPLGSIDRGEAQRQRLVARRRAPVRRHRRADRRHPGQAARTSTAAGAA